MSGNGRRSRAARSPASSAASAPPATGRTSASPWTRAIQRAVTHVFVELHKRGLIYRDKRLVNWDPRFQTAISDLEVETRDVQGKFWTLAIRSPTARARSRSRRRGPRRCSPTWPSRCIPDDERYKALIGKQIRHPITGRLIPIIADEHADPELGSGAVKITPGHDFNDFEVGKRAGFKPADMLNMLDAHGASSCRPQDGLIPQDLLGLDRDDARKAVVELLEAEGALVRVEDRVIPTPYGDRSGVVIEPWLTDQWYVDAAKLAEPAIEAVQDRRHQDRPRDAGRRPGSTGSRNPALVRLAPAVVGPPDSGLVWRDGRSAKTSFVAETG